eukprot:m.176269 g.176269  ORF g.176269 m.176269 type:complete len:88 (+) comp13528_c0_seq5:1514-1777(+)
MASQKALELFESAAKYPALHNERVRAAPGWFQAFGEETITVLFGKGGSHQTDQEEEIAKFTNYALVVPELFLITIIFKYQVTIICCI